MRKSCVGAVYNACSGYFPPHPNPLPRSTGGEGTMIVITLRFIPVVICHLSFVICYLLFVICYLNSYRL